MSRISALWAIVLSIVLIGMQPAQAAIISVVPSTTSAEVGDAVSIDIVISDLGDGTTPSVGVLDFDFLFDDTLLQYLSATFGTQLDVLGLGSDQAIDDSVAGTLNIFELSFDDTADLDSFQAASFTVVTLSFDAIAAGVINFQLLVNALGDGLGDPITVTQINSAMLTINDPGNTNPIPLPAAAWFMLSGLGAYAASRKSKAK